MRVWGILFLFLSRTRYSSLFSGAISRELTIPTSECVERRLLSLPFLPLASNLNDQWGVIRSPPRLRPHLHTKGGGSRKNDLEGGKRSACVRVWATFQTFLCL